MTEAMQPQQITVTRVLDAPREIVWRAFTEPERLARWWGPPGWSTDAADVTIDARPGGKFKVTSVSDDGQRMPVAGVYREVVRPERLVMEEPAEANWHDGAVTEVTLTDAGEGRTELVLRSTVHTSAEMARNAERGVEGSVGRLAALVEETLITGVDFVSVPSADFDAALRFYGEVLDLERSSIWQRGGEPPAGAEFETGNMTIALIGTEALGIEFRPNTVPVALQVDDVAAARAKLEARGVTFSGETIDSGVCHIASFQDPEGNALILHHRYAPFTRPAPRRGG
jgi:uncharacterized protein YndB with AHSA1/START domain/predicted enzyme related to lactoylglutathione lyase